MSNKDLAELIRSGDDSYGKKNDNHFIGCGCCTDEMMDVGSKLKNDDADYCVASGHRNPTADGDDDVVVACSPDDADGWQPCYVSDKDGTVKKINICVTRTVNDDTNGSSIVIDAETKCVDPFDDIFRTVSANIQCGTCKDNFIL